MIFHSDRLKALKRQEEERTDYLKKKDFGKVPDYLGKVKSEIEAEEKARKEAEDAKNRPSMRLLTESEKDDMISGLKEKHQEIHNEYKKLPVAINTVAQKNK